MEIKIKSDYLDTLILIVMYLALAILDFFDYTRIINLVLAPLCLFRIITLGKIDFKQLGLTALLILLFLLSCIFGDSVSKQVLHSNALMLLYSYIYILCLYIM